MSFRRAIARLSRRVSPFVFPVITALSITTDARFNGAGGVAITISGANFVPASQALVAGVAATTSYTSSTSLIVTVPNTTYWEAGVYNITVQNPTGSPSAPATLTITQPSYLLAEYRGDLGLTFNSSTVQVWADQSGKGDPNRNAAQLTPANQPTYTASDSNLNGKPSLSSTPTTIALITGIWSSPSSQPFRHYVVGYQSTQVGNSGGYGFMIDGIATTHRAAFMQKSTQGDMYAGGTERLFAMTFTAPGVFVAEFNDVTSKQSRSAKTLTAVSGSPGTQAPTGLTIFNDNTATHSGTCAIGHVFTIDSSAITTAQHGEMMAYAGNRYGISIGA